MPAMRAALALPQSEPAETRAVAAISRPESVSATEPATAPRQQTVDEELDAWKEARKVRRRSFREPWRSVSIAATIGLVGTGWMLPESVAWDAQIALGILTIGAFYAGWRRPR